MTTTDALFLARDLTVSIGTREVADRAPGQALVRIEFAGVCGSDLHVLKTGDWVTSWPAILGHEVIGIVQECPGAELSPGTRVVVDSRVPCGDCSGCSTAANLCENLAWVGEIIPGGYERHAIFDVASLHACPPELEPGIGVLAEPLAVAMHGVNRLHTEPTDVLIVGYGPIGALVHAEIQRRWPNCAVYVREPHGQRRLLAEAFGARIDSDRERWPLVVDAAGYPTSMADAVDLTQHGGSILAIAIPHGPVTIDAQGLVERSISLIGSVGFDDELNHAIEALAQNPERYRALVTEAVLLDEAIERLKTLHSHPAAGKVVIRL